MIINTIIIIIGRVDMSSVMDAVIDGSNPQLCQFVVSLSRTFYPHCFIRLS